MKTIEQNAREYALSEHHPTGHYTIEQIEEIKEFAYLQGAEDFQQWISVEDELPELKEIIHISDEVLVKTSSGKMYVSYFYFWETDCRSDCGENWSIENQIKEKVTHWRYIEL